MIKLWKAMTSVLLDSPYYLLSLHFDETDGHVGEIHAARS